ncbi:MAG: ABC transporter ATP-binding protein [Candidatus Nealsonbacteria bacterium]|nr:ABC transporter ATP-binding protein [Candidatus Nealsonbacteria bacterium]
MIHLEEVSKIYQTADGPVHALSQASLDVEKGQFVAVRGPSGCGKSTLLLVTGGLGTPTSGRVVVAGTDLPSATPAQRAAFRGQTVGFVFQMFHLLPYLTVLDNVAAAAVPEQQPAARDRAGELLKRFGLEHRLRHRPAQLSAGECQRVAVARALINRPQLILADEPTGNLDPDSAAMVMDLLADFNRDGGTVMLVTHEEQAAGYAQRTVSMEGGKIVGSEE